MRIAVVSDIHGNRTAFEAVLADLQRTAPDVVLHGGSRPGRIEMVLFPKESPLATENMWLMLSGEQLADAPGQSYTLRGAYFYRILSHFITQVRGQAVAAAVTVLNFGPHT